MSGKYVAYTGSYSYNSSCKGITIYDVDLENGNLTFRCEVDAENTSFLCVSRNGRTLYAVADEGLIAFRILPDGNLEHLNSVRIRGMRGCHAITGINDEYIYVSGYYDGKETVLSLKEDGSIGAITAGIFLKGVGTVADRSMRPHACCGGETPEGNYALVSDIGLDQIKIFKIDRSKGELQLVDAIRCGLGTSPIKFVWSSDGRFLYVLCELSDTIQVYEYQNDGNKAEFQKIQSIPAYDEKFHGSLIQACAIRISPDSKHIYVSNSGDNSIGVFNRDPDTGILSLCCCVPIAGQYPKDIGVFPDGNHLVSVNHSSGDLSFFALNYEKGTMVMRRLNQKATEVNCCVFAELPE